MLLKHSVQYLLARGLPGIVNFVAIAIYTHMLSVDEYGRYALVVAGIGLFDIVFFQWLRLSLVRFLPVRTHDSKKLLSTILSGFLMLALITGVLGVLLALLWPDQTTRGLILFAIPLLWAQAWFDLNLELARSRLQPYIYGFMSGLKAVSSLIIGWGSILCGLGPWGPMIGLLLGMLLVGFLNIRMSWTGLAPIWDREISHKFLCYGLPLTATFALSFVVSTSDRFIIAYFLGEGPAGVYSASYDLAQQSLSMLMLALNLSSFPLILQALEHNGLVAARQKARDSTTLLLTAAVPAAFAFVFFPAQIAMIYGHSFRNEAELLLPIISVAALIAGIKTYHFDRAFHLSTKTGGQVWVSFASATANILLNWAWIPRFGLIGAAYATLFAYILGLMLSAYIGQRLFAVPFPWKEAFLISMATGIVVAVLMFVRYVFVYENYIVQAVVGGALYLLLIWFFDVSNVRSHSLKMLNAFGLRRWIK